MPLDRLYGQPMDLVTWGDDRFMHTDPQCRAAADSAGEKHRVRFGAFLAARMCGCCHVEPAAADAGLADVVHDLVTLCEALEEDAEEVESRQQPDYEPNFRRPDFNRDHWRYLQLLLSTAADSLQARPWLLSWARPSLERAAACTERLCEEQRTIIDTATVERAALALQQCEHPTAQQEQAWRAWRQRKDWRVHTSPDYVHYDLNARLQPVNPASAPSGAATVEISMRLPAIGRDEDGFRMVETLSLWEIAVIAAYRTTADWAAGVVTLAAPPAVAQELANPARALDMTPRPSGAGPNP